MTDNGAAVECAAMQKNQFPAGYLIGRMQKNAAHPPDGRLTYPAVSDGFFRRGFHLFSPSVDFHYHLHILRGYWFGHNAKYTGEFSFRNPALESANAFNWD